MPMRASQPMWNTMSPDRKLEYLYEQTEDLHKLVDRLTSAVEILRQQLAAVQRAPRGTSP
jgi:hypothetical protein